LQDPELVTVEEIMVKVGKMLGKADFSTKSDIIAMLLQAVTGHTFPTDSIRDAIYAVLHGANYKHSDVEQFVQGALQLLFVISDHDRDFLVELMFAYMEGTDSTRYASLDCLACFYV